MKRKLYLFACCFFLFASLQSCENECQDCTPLENNLFVNIDFINQTEILQQEMIQADINDELMAEGTTNQILLDSITTLNDSIGRLQLGIDTGNLDLEPLLLDVTPVLTEITERQRLQEITIDSLNTLNTSKLRFIQQMEQGIIQIQNISSPQHDLLNLSFEDSTNDYRLPLPNDTSFKSIDYLIMISDREYSISIPYQNTVIIDNSGAIRTSIFGLDSTLISFSAFDSLKLNCLDTTCISNNATITAYF